MPLQLDISSVRPYICLDCIAGSKAYALETPSSDDDFKGVFLAPLPMVLTGEAPHMVQDEKHDRQYTELGAFCRELELRKRNNSTEKACGPANTFANAFILRELATLDDMVRAMPQADEPDISPLDDFFRRVVMAG